MWWIGNFANDVGATTDTSPRVSGLLEFHIACRSKITDEPVRAIPSQVSAPLQILHTHLPVVRPGEQVRQHAPGCLGQARVIDNTLVENEVPVAPGCPDNGISHPWHHFL